MTRTLIPLAAWLIGSLAACGSGDRRSPAPPSGEHGPLGPPPSDQQRLEVQPVFQGEGAPMMDPHRCPPGNAEPSARAETWVREHLHASPPVEQALYQQRLDEVFLQMSQALEREDLCAYHELSGPAEIYALRCNHAHEDRVLENLAEWNRWWEQNREVPLREAWLRGLLERDRVCDDAWRAYVLPHLEAAGCDLAPEVLGRIEQALQGNDLAPERRDELERWWQEQRQGCSREAGR
jgi:hypothetical protein